MGAAIRDVEKPEKPPLWVRLRSWKWWVFGVINPRPIAHPKEGWAKELWASLVVWMVIGVQPWISTWVNRYPPGFSSLQKIDGEVIDTAWRSPHLMLRTRSGEVLRMEYPIFLTVYGSIGAGNRSLGPNSEKLMGCHATVWFDKPRFTLWERYRVWQIICTDRPVYSSYEEFVRRWSWMFELIYFGFAIFIFIPVVYWLSVRKYWRE